MTENEECIVSATKIRVDLDNLVKLFIESLALQIFPVTISGGCQLSMELNNVTTKEKKIPFVSLVLSWV